MQEAQEASARSEERAQKRQRDLEGAEASLAQEKEVRELMEAKIQSPDQSVEEARSQAIDLEQSNSALEQALEAQGKNLEEERKVREAAEAERSELGIQVVSLESTLGQARTELQGLQARVKQQQKEHDEALESASQAARDTTMTLELVRSEKLQMVDQLERLQEKAKQLEDSREEALRAEKQRLQTELLELDALRGEVASLKEEVAGLRGTREQLQRTLTEVQVQLKDEQERVRSASSTGVVWSARREAPKEEGLLGKIRSPFKKG